MTGIGDDDVIQGNESAERDLLNLGLSENLNSRV
jgi:hypothetical protein